MFRAQLASQNKEHTAQSVTRKQQVNKHPNTKHIPFDYGFSPEMFIYLLVLFNRAWAFHVIIY